MLQNVQQSVIGPIIKAVVKPGTLIYTDEYTIYDRLKQWGYLHKSVNHGKNEFARDEDGDGFCEVHVNTIEGAWSLLGILNINSLVLEFCIILPFNFN
jgi:transposase